MYILSPIDIAPEDLPYKMEYSVDLDGVTFIYKISYAVRQDRWYIDLYDASENPLVLGKKLVIDYPLYEKHRKAGMPLGELVFTDTSGTKEECGFDDMSNRCKLFYATKEDVEEGYGILDTLIFNDREILIVST